MIIEAIIATSLLTSGASLLSATGMRGWLLLPFGFLAGITLHIIILSLLVIFNITTSPLIGMFLTVFLAALYWMFMRVRHNCSMLPGWKVLVSGTGFFFFVLCLYIIVEPYFYIKHVDSMEYLAIAGMMAEGTLEEGVSLYQFEKRKLAAPILHASTNSFGQLYNITIGPLIALSTIGAFAWFAINGIKTQANKRWALPIAIFGILLLVTNNRFIMHALYINSHLLFAALLMVFIASGWVLITKPGKLKMSLQTLQVLSIPPLVLARVEAPFIIGITLIPLLASKKFSVKHKRLLLSVFGISVIMWYGLLFILRYDGDIPSASITGFLLLGIIILLLALAWKQLNRVRLVKHAAGISEIGIWALLAGFWYWKPAVLYSVVDSFLKNAVYLDSYWGSSLVVLIVLTGFLLLLRYFSQQTILRLPVTTFLPLLAILPYLKGGTGYREGGGDSMNRMLFHIVPLTILFITISIATGKPRFVKAKRWAQARILKLVSSTSTR